MAGPTKSLILPCENRTRELDAKLLLGCVAAERGFRSFVGAKREINIQAVKLPRSIYLQKSLSKRSYRMYDILERMGHWIVTADEEGVVYLNPEHFWFERVYAPTFLKARALLAWGPDNEQVWSTHPAYDGAPIAVTGNPRIDLLRPELRAFFDDEANDIRERMGPFVMINSNFGAVNHYFPSKSVYLHLAREAENDPEVASTFDAGMARHVLTLFQSFREMLPAVARTFPDKTFVLRPHPSENHDTWLEATRDCPNMHVIHEGNVVPWLIAADGLIHNGCTTGLEAHILGTPTISYEPINSDIYDLQLPNDVSRRTTDIPSLVKLVGELGTDAAHASHEGDDRARETVARYVAAVDGPLASDRMCDHMETWLEEWSQEPRPGAWRRGLGSINGRVRALEKWVYQHRSQHNNSRDYVDHVFSDLTPEDIQVRLSRFRGALGRFQNVRARQHSHNVFELSGD